MSVIRKDQARLRAIENLDIIKRFTLEISSINSHLERVRQLWGKALGVMVKVNISSTGGASGMAWRVKLRISIDITMRISRRAR